MKRIFTFGPIEFRFNLIVALCVFATMFGLVRLGIWQLHRAQEKIEQQSNYLEMQNDEATSLDAVPVAGLEFDSIQLQNRKVSLEGRYLNDRTVFLVFQTFEDQVGYEIFTPFYVDAISEIVMVSRGWTGAASYEALQEALPVLTGQQSLLGQIYVHTEKSLKRTNDIEVIEWPLLARYMNTIELSQYFDEPVFPYVVRLSENQAGVLVRHWPEVTVDTSRNFSYALQWFAMAIAVLLVALILSSNLMHYMQEKLDPI